jgi:23S rRNA G2445 N2-methylase RlmL
LNYLETSEIIFEIKEYIKPESWIIDPFCGTGTLLLERALKMPSREYYGIDTYGEAIKEARINAEAAGVKVNFINRNFFDFTSDYPFQEIIAEFPDLFGKEPKEKNSFYESFFRKAIEIADEGAIMFLVSEEENLIKKHIRLSSNLKLIRSKHLGKSKSIYIIGVEK